MYQAWLGQLESEEDSPMTCRNGRRAADVPNADEPVNRFKDGPFDVNEYTKTAPRPRSGAVVAVVLAAGIALIVIGVAFAG